VQGYGFEELANSQATPWTTAGSAAEIDAARTETPACMGDFTDIGKDRGELRACMHRAPSTEAVQTRDVRTT
jgi:hypothetical protein